MSLVRKERDKGICKLLAKGATYQEAGDTYNISRQRAHQIAKSRCPQIRK